MTTDTREYIIDEAFKLFLHRSYEAVSISVISEAIGMTKGALYHHFKNKEELFRAVIDKYFVIHTIKVDIETVTLKEYTELSIGHARKLLYDMFGSNNNYVPVNYLSLIADGFRHYEGFSDQKLGFMEIEISKIELILANAIKRGEIRSDVDIQVLAQHFFSVSIGMAGNIMRNHSIEDAISAMGNQIKQLYKLLKL